MTALYVSFVVVALAEMGDKTQLVALTLASRYRCPWTGMLGILIATLVNHALAASIGGVDGGGRAGPLVHVLTLRRPRLRGRRSACWPPTGSPSSPVIG